MKKYSGYTPNQLHGRQKAKLFLYFIVLLVVIPALAASKLPLLLELILLVLIPSALYGLYRIKNGPLVFSISQGLMNWNGSEFIPSSIKSLVYKRVIFKSFGILVVIVIPRAFRPIYLTTEIVTIVTEVGDFEVGKLVKKTPYLEEASEPVRIQGNSFLYSESIFGYPVRDMILLSEEDFNEMIQRLTNYSNQKINYLSGGSL